LKLFREFGVVGEFSSLLFCGVMLILVVGMGEMLPLFEEESFLALVRVNFFGEWAWVAGEAERVAFSSSAEQLESFDPDLCRPELVLLKRFIMAVLCCVFEFECDSMVR